MSNRFLEKIYSRHCVRKFKNKKVAKKDLAVITEAGLRAPSSKNSQPWYLLVVEGKQKEAVAKAVERNFFTRNRVPLSVTGKKIKGMFDSTRESIQIIRDVPALILIFNRQPYSKGIFELKEIPSRVLTTYGVEIVGIGACMQNVLLATHALGLVAVPIADIYPGAIDIQKKFKIPYNFVIGIAVGYPDEKTFATKKGKGKLVKWLN